MTQIGNEDIRCKRQREERQAWTRYERRAHAGPSGTLEVPTTCGYERAAQNGSTASHAPSIDNTSSSALYFYQGSRLIVFSM